MKARKKNDVSPGGKPDGSPVPVEGGRNPRGDTQPVRLEDMVNLLRATRQALPDQTSRVVEVLALNHGEGVSTVVRGLAHAAARIGNARVLVCDATRERGNFGFFGLNANVPSLKDFAMQRAELEDVVFHVPSGDFKLCALTGPDDGVQVALNLDLLRPTFAKLRELFDFVLIDAPPANGSVLGPAIAREADGVIFVVECERTRVPAAVAALQAIDVNNGRVLGVVLNKRRFHIPKFMYHWI